MSSTDDSSPRYRQTLRRFFGDMHIADWDDGFLARFDPEGSAKRLAAAGVGGAVIYAKSHVGLCNYPTRVGGMHANLGSRSALGEFKTALERQGIRAAVYLSTTFDNWASEQHPEWRQVDLASGTDLNHRMRYGLLCPNNPGYREYELGILAEILTYHWDAIFLDMAYFATLCSCDCCRERFRVEAGADIPTVIDWTDPTWCAYQAARERWIVEWTALLVETCRRLCPSTEVTHNLGAALLGWRTAQRLSVASLDTYTSGDLYGGSVEQLFVCKLHLHLSRERPAEFMTSVTANLGDHVGLKSEDQLAWTALGALATGNAITLIDGINPDGTTCPGVYERMTATYERVLPYEEVVGGVPVEDIAVYVSSTSLVDNADNGTAVPPTRRAVPTDAHSHLVSAMQACLTLQRAHLPFGVLSEADLDSLSRFSVVVLPNASRLTEAECDSLRDYVAGGGRLYASRYASLLPAAGGPPTEFALGDVLGVRFVAEEQGRQVYLRATDPLVAEAIAPQQHVGHRVRKRAGGVFPLCGMPRVGATAGRVLAALTVPYGYPADGTATDHQWASIHSSPPCEDRDDPVVVTTSFGAGRTTYSALDIESSDAPAHRSLFLALVQDLLGRPPAFEADTHPAVWVSLFDQPENERLLVTLLHYPGDLPAPDIDATIRLRHPQGRRLTGVVLAHDGAAVPTTVTGDGVEATVTVADGLVMLLAEYAAS